MTRVISSWTPALFAALALAACNKGVGNNVTAEQNTALPALPQAVPMTAGPATTPTPAPATSTLPPAQPVQVATVAQPADAYAYIDRATALSDTFGDAPPDYAFDYDGVSPWAWQASDGDMQFAEPVDGGYRYYYYQPGEDYPYLVRDPSYSYAYDGSNLVAVYTAAGALLSAAAYREHLDAASRYRARAAELYRASHDHAHRGVIGANWAARRQEIAAARTRWTEARVQQPDWVAYHQSHQAEEQQHWALERDRRVTAAQHFDDWRKQDFRGPPPAAGSTSLPPGDRDDHANHSRGQGSQAAPDRPGHVGGRPDPEGQGRPGRNQHPAQPRAVAGETPPPGAVPGHRADRPDQDHGVPPAPHARPAEAIGRVQSQTLPSHEHGAPVGEPGRLVASGQSPRVLAHAVKPAEHVRPTPPVAVHHEPLVHVARPAVDHAPSAAPVAVHHEMPAHVAQPVERAPVSTPHTVPSHEAAHPPAAPIVPHPAAPHPAPHHANPDHGGHDRDH